MVVSWLGSTALVVLATPLIAFLRGRKPSAHSLAAIRTEVFDIGEPKP